MDSADDSVTFELPMMGVSALQAHAYERTFGLLLFADGVDSQAGGVDGATGVGVRIGSRYFIATAGHNLVATPDDGIVLVHEDHVARKPTPILRRWPTAGHAIPTPDIGYIEIGEAVAAASPKKFVPLEQVDTQFSRVGIHVVLVGHPVENIPAQLIESQRLINLRAMGFATNSVALPDGRDASHEFALAVHEVGTNVDTGAPLPTPSLEGISGAGVWTFPRPSQAGIWSPAEAKLVGIQHSWRRSAGMMFCVRMNNWLAAVARHYPDVAAEIQRLSE